MLERRDVRTVFDFHAHGVDTLLAVRPCRFRLVMAGRPVVLGPGDAFNVPEEME